MTKADTYLKRELESVLQIYISTIEIGPSLHPTFRVHQYLWPQWLKEVNELGNHGLSFFYLCFKNTGK